MIKKIFFTTAIFILSCSHVFAQSTHEFEFARDYIKSLGHLKNNTERAKEFRSEDFDTQKDFEVAALKNANLSIVELRAARLIISKYETSHSQIVKEAAQAIIKTYDTHLEIAEKQLALQKVLWKPQGGASQEPIRTAMQEVAAQSNSAWTMLGDCSVLVTNSLVSRTPDEKGELTYFAITSAERKELTAQLDDIFGDSIKGGMKDEQTQLQLCGAILREALVGENKSSDER